MRGFVICVISLVLATGTANAGNRKILRDLEKREELTEQLKELRVVRDIEHAEACTVVLNAENWRLLTNLVILVGHTEIPFGATRKTQKAIVRGDMANLILHINNIEANAGESEGTVYVRDLIEKYRKRRRNDYSFVMVDIMQRVMGCAANAQIAARDATKDVGVTLEECMLQ